MVKMENILIYDIETATNGSAINEIEKHKLKYFGAYSYKTKQFYFLSDKKEIQNLLNQHKIIVGYNNKYYDNPILEQEGIKIKFKVSIDLLKTIQQRAGLTPFKNSFLSYIIKSYSLDSVTQTLGLAKDETKLSIDYTIFNKDNPTEVELKEMKKYTLRDIELTKKLFEWVNDKFDGWKHHLLESDQRNLVHLSCAPSVYAYKVLAHRCGFKEEYTNSKELHNQGMGGYVAYPAQEKVEGNIYCMDFASLYPHIMIQCNLYGRNKKENVGWSGNDILSIDGFYSTENIHKVSNVLMDIYNERKELKKKKDSREYGLKIVLNICYGLLRNPIFKNVYDKVAGNDCCIIGQQWIKYARKKFKDAGYFVFYTDTDSVYLQDPFEDKERLMLVKQNIIMNIKRKIPFPQETFDMDIDYKIDMIHFFKGGNIKEDSELDEEDNKNKKLELMKKNYIFIYEDNGEKKMFIKNLGIVKRTCSEVSKKIFWDNMVPHIIKTHDCKFENSEIERWIDNYLNEDVMSIASRITVKNKKEYKSKGCIQVQAHDYIPKDKQHPLGVGIHYFIPNTKFGIGKGGKKYCTIEEFKKYCTIKDVYIHGIMRELRYFNKDYKEQKLSNKKKKEIKFEDTMKQIELW